MSLILPPDLPARGTLSTEGLPVFAPGERLPDGTLRLRIAILNLMPNKSQTEAQLLRLVGATPYAVEPILFSPASHRSNHRTTPQAHLQAFYHPFPRIQHEHFDGLIITGAPVEHLPFDL
jgi:homoserine O-succinyltransferase